VARAPYTDEVAAAHGGIEVTEQCVGCGARRQVLRNQRYEEVGPWGESQHARDEAASRAWLETVRARRECAAMRETVLIDGIEVRLSIDEEGGIAAETAGRVDELLHRAAASTWTAGIEAAKRLQAAIAEYQRLRSKA